MTSPARSRWSGLRPVSRSRRRSTGRSSAARSSTWATRSRSWSRRPEAPRWTPPRRCSSSTSPSRRWWTRRRRSRTGRRSCGSSSAPTRRTSGRSPGGDFDAAQADAEVTVEARYVNHRTSGAPIEPRCSIAEERGDKLTLYSTTQIPHIARFVLSGMLGIAEDKLRVVAPDVGGGFGAKLQVYAEEALVLALAKRLGPPRQVGRDALRAHDDEPPRPRPDQLHHAHREARRHRDRLPGADHRRPRRLPAAADAVHPDAGLPGDGRLLRDPVDRPPLHRRLHEQDVHGRDPRGGPAGGHLLDRADHGQARARARHGPARAAAQELHPQGAVPVRHGARHHLRLGRLPRHARQAARRTSTWTRSAASRQSCASRAS